MKPLYTLFLLLYSSLCFTQNEAANWYFGQHAGINFNNNTGDITALTDGELNTIEGCTSISDENGNLLLYTDGITVYNRNHNIMQNGSNLFGNPSSTQSAIIIPKPSDANIYYIFTQGTQYTNPDTGELEPDKGFNFSEVNMTLDGGYGAITSNKNIPLLKKASEKLSAVYMDCGTQNIWVTTIGSIDALNNPDADSNNNTTFYTFKVTNTELPVLDNTINLEDINNNNITKISDRRGYLKFSPDGTKLACASPNPSNTDAKLIVFDFDSATGTISNGKSITISIPVVVNPPNKPYGIEFSPNNRFLYVSAYNDLPPNNSTSEEQKSCLLQYDLNAGDESAVSASQIIIEEPKTGYRSALQLGPNAKIYKTESESYNQGLPYLSVINSPNLLGNNCNYQANDIDLQGRNARQGLPPFIASFFAETIDIIGNDAETIYLPLCTNETYTLIAEDIPNATYTWSIDGVEIPTPTPPNELFINTAATYEVNIEIPSNDCESKEGRAIVSYHEYPTANQPQDIVVCDDNNNNHWAFDFTTQDATVLNGQDATQYSVHYFATEQDAINHTNEIIGMYDNMANPQELFVRVHNNENPNCYATTSFFTYIYNTPTASNTVDLITCDDASDGDTTNGFATINLDEFNTIVYGTQSTTAYTISYHENQTDADNNANPLPTNYYTNNTTVFVRIENNENTDCYDTNTFEIQITPVPEAVNTTLLQCDADGLPDGFTTYNLYEAANALTNNNADAVTISFYYSQEYLDADSNPLNGNNYTNTANPQTIYVKIVDNTTQCSSQALLILETSATSLEDYQVPGVCDEPNSQDGINSFNLEEIETAIQLYHAINLPISFYPTYEDALLEQNPLASPYSNVSPYSDSIYARAENANACYGISKVSFTIYPLPQLEENESIVYCLNTYPETLTLDAGVIGNPEGDFYYLWSTGAITPEIEVNAPGTYTITATSVYGCTASRNITIEASNTATIHAITVVDGSADTLVTIDASGEGDYEYAIYNSGELVEDFQWENTFYNLNAGIYTAVVRDTKNNCGIVEQDFSIIGFPKYFTPNGDIYHETWNVLGVSEQFQPNTKVLIFNRHGKLLYQVDPLIAGWDGTYNGKNMPADDYWFKVNLQDGREYVNHFSLLR